MDWKERFVSFHLFHFTALTTVSWITAELILIHFIDNKYELINFSVYIVSVFLLHCIRTGLNLRSVVLWLAMCETITARYSHFLLEGFFSS